MSPKDVLLCAAFAVEPAAAHGALHERVFPNLESLGEYALAEFVLQERHAARYSGARNAAEQG